MNKYNVVMDDNRRIDIPATCAADAIQTALEKHLGHKVVSCDRGGVIHYDIPNHKAIDAVPDKPQAPRKPRTEMLPPDHPSKAPADWLRGWYAQQLKKAVK